MPSFTKGDVTIQYEEKGSGFPLLVTPGGGLNSVASGWPRQVINVFEDLSDEFRCITMAVSYTHLTLPTIYSV